MDFKYLKIFMILFFMVTSLSCVNNEMLDQLDNLYKIVLFFLMGLGVIAASVLTVYSKLRPLLEKRKNMKEYGKEPAQNFETIIDYLRSGNPDLYDKAFTYLRQHSVYPHSILEELSKIILKKKPYQKFEWIDFTKRLQASRFICLILEKNRANNEGVQPRKNEYCKGVRELL